MSHLLDVMLQAKPHLDEPGVHVETCSYGPPPRRCRAIAGSGLVPVPRDRYESVVYSGKGAEASLRRFARAYDAVRVPRKHVVSITLLLSDSERITHNIHGLEPDLVHRFQAEAHATLALGLQRVRDYQDARCARLYLQRLEQVLTAACGADPEAAPGFATTRETARRIAIWMAFDDIVRVADLKRRTNRWDRVRGRRYATGQAMIERWPPRRGARQRRALATRARGRAVRSIDQGAMAQPTSAARPTCCVRSSIGPQAARRPIRALADRNGQALDGVLAEHGAPARPVKAQPIRRMRRPGQAAAKH
ncbi:MAG: Indolepyruvate oxidoreductase subunit IorB II [Burkholderiaceae bacterium]|nr:MAG: Indolepyruvate oxidoreductase subunit IorB II [Burkholderiaceae bacterium]